MVTLKHNDTARSLTTTLRYLTGAAIDLTTATEVRLTVVSVAGGVKVDTLVTIAAPLTSGVVTYKFTQSDFASTGTGRFKMEWEITFASGELLHVPTFSYDELQILPTL